MVGYVWEWGKVGRTRRRSEEGRHDRRVPQGGRPVDDDDGFDCNLPLDWYSWVVR